MSDPEQHEAIPSEPPRIYAASLSDYNAGVLHGTWLDVTGDVEDLQDGISRMLKASPTTERYGEPAEEWAIHDYENWGVIRLGEYESLERLCQVAAGIIEHGPAYAAWVGMEYRESVEPEDFADAFHGEWASREAYCDNVLEDFGIDLDQIEGVPESLRPYLRLDMKAWLNECELSGELTVVEHDDGIWVFTP